MKAHGIVIICTIFFIESFSMAGEVSWEKTPGLFSPVAGSVGGSVHSPSQVNIKSGINNRINYKIPSIGEPSISGENKNIKNCDGPVLRVGSNTFCNKNGIYNGALINENGIVDTSTRSPAGTSFGNNSTKHQLIPNTDNIVDSSPDQFLANSGDCINAFYGNSCDLTLNCNIAGKEGIQCNYFDIPEIRNQLCIERSQDIAKSCENRILTVLNNKQNLKYKQTAEAFLTRALIETSSTENYRVSNILRKLIAYLNTQNGKYVKQPQQSVPSSSPSQGQDILVLNNSIK